MGRRWMLGFGGWFVDDGGVDVATALLLSLRDEFMVFVACFVLFQMKHKCDVSMEGIACELCMFHLLSGASDTRHLNEIYRYWDCGFRYHQQSG